MSKPPPRIIQGLLRFHFNQNQTHFSSSSPHSVLSNRLLNSASTTSNTQRNASLQLLISKPIYSNGVLHPKLDSFRSFLMTSSRKYSSSSFKISDASSKTSGFGKLCYNPLKVRCYSLKTPSFGSKLNGSAAKKLVEKPLAAVNSAFSRYKEAVGLQVEGLWKRNYLLVVGFGGAALCFLLWRIMFSIADATVGISEGLAKYGFLALSTAIVAFAGLYIRSRYTINPDRVYRMAMRTLNTSAGVLEVMGAPLAGTDLRAYVMSGGGITLSKFKPRLRSKRCFLIFPIRGSERKGLVSVEVKKKKGQYDMKLLAVDIPMASGPDQRLFLVGDEEEYKIGGGLIAELRDPVVKAMTAAKEFEELDDIEEEEDAERELQDAERKRLEDIEKLKRETGK